MVHLYLSLVPEALIASMLDPEEFGSYYAVGTKKKSSGQAIFFEVDPAFRSKYFRIEEGLSRCVPHEDGSPKSSIYISVYRVLEHVDISALGKLYLSTQDGRTLGLDASDEVPAMNGGLHLYKEIVPVTPLVASRLNAVEFFDLIVRNPTSLVTLPAIAFTELRLGELAEDPEMGEIRRSALLKYGSLTGSAARPENQTGCHENGGSCQPGDARLSHRPKRILCWE